MLYVLLRVAHMNFQAICPQRTGEAHELIDQVALLAQQRCRHMGRVALWRIRCVRARYNHRRVAALAAIQAEDEMSHHKPPLWYTLCWSSISSVRLARFQSCNLCAQYEADGWRATMCRGS